jgi:hypothetical protein
MGRDEANTLTTAEFLQLVPGFFSTDYGAVLEASHTLCGQIQVDRFDYQRLLEPQQPTIMLLQTLCHSIPLNATLWLLANDQKLLDETCRVHFAFSSWARAALWLGHEDVQSTHVYLQADLAMKEKALDKLTPPETKAPRFKPSDKLLAFLASL